MKLSTIVLLFSCLLMVDVAATLLIAHSRKAYLEDHEVISCC